MGHRLTPCLLSNFTILYLKYTSNRKYSHFTMTQIEWMLVNGVIVFNCLTLVSFKLPLTPPSLNSGSRQRSIGIIMIKCDLVRYVL